MAIIGTVADGREALISLTLLGPGESRARIRMKKSCLTLQNESRMPKLDCIGKQYIVNHTDEVPAIEEL